ncbi:expressed unknown protein [Seminavis robusta]|uniref:Uncharacterized protein n=1 Tax=Seminavis robusta TaxID=568900 RepID=A0A9N8HSZ4_9STRA|nr:expressed unknown protein [Seminavis robusta]|eukprot:Sro1510_g278630.1 n/a (131) ;mRNA; r:11126-11518
MTGAEVAEDEAKGWGIMDRYNKTVSGEPVKSRYRYGKQSKTSSSLEDDDVPIREIEVHPNEGNVGAMMHEAGEMLSVVLGKLGLPQDFKSLAEALEFKELKGDVSCLVFGGNSYDETDDDDDYEKDSNSF